MDPEKFAIRREGDAAFPVETPAESQSVEKVEKVDEDTGDKKPVDDKNLPFHEHPRWKEREDSWNKRLADIKKESDDKIAALESRVAPTVEKEIDVPGWFGGDAEQYKQFLEDQKKLVSNAEQERIQEQQKQADNQKKLVEDATTEFNTALAAIETESGEKIDPNKFLKFVMDEQFIDFQSKKWDYTRAWKFYKIANPPKESNLGNRKAFADATLKDKNTGSTDINNRPFKTAKDFRGAARPW